MCLKVMLLLLSVAVSICLADNIDNRAVDTQHGCMRSEVWKDCGTPCEEVCGKAKDPNCGTQCVPACQCRDGYARSTSDPRSSCIPREQCGRCGAHERVYCELSCDNINTHPHVCPVIQMLHNSGFGHAQMKCSARPDCLCTDGYIRDGTTGECVLPSQCPPATLTTPPMHR